MTFYFNRQYFQLFSTNPSPPPVDKVHAPLRSNPGSASVISGQFSRCFQFSVAIQRPTIGFRAQRTTYEAKLAAQNRKCVFPAIHTKCIACIRVLYNIVVSLYIFLVLWGHGMPVVYTRK